MMWSFNVIRLAFSGLFLVGLMIEAYAQTLAQGSGITAQYDIRFVGLKVGKGALDAVIKDGDYKISASAKVTGVASIISDGKGGASANGNYTFGAILPKTYIIDNYVEDKLNTVRMTLNKGRIVSSKANPPSDDHPDRIAVTTEHTTGVIDPLSAFLMPLPASDKPLSPQAACNRTLKIYDGRQRYDISFAYVTTEQKYSGVKGFSGPVYKCSARYKPIAGHRSSRRVTVFMEENKDMAVWLAAVPDTGMVAPVKIEIGLPKGRISIEATKFFITPQVAQN